MPTYIYVGCECGVQEVVQAFSDDSLTACPQCGGHIKRRLTGFHVAAAATPTRSRSSAPPRTPDPAWERGISGEHRPDGSFMPYVNNDFSPIRVKQFAENRSKYEPKIKELKQSPTST